MIAKFSGGCAFYKAELEHYDKENPSSKRHSTVLIKCYPPSGTESCGEKEVLTEIEILSGGVKHPNIVNLLGFCYLENLKDKPVLTWEKRLKIRIDVAHALRYIHSEIEDQKMIINHDIWSYNIGLDENFGAKIINFWWSVFLSPDQENKDHHLIGVGRKFNRDPEYEKNRKLKKESDVYGFGVVLFEILCGRLAYDPIYLKESWRGLAPVARRSFSTRTLEELIDPIIKEEVGENGFVLNRGPNKDSLHTFITIAHQCVAETQDQRPTMKVVVKELEKALFFQNNNKDNPKMSLEDIKQVTPNFHDDNFIGGGGFGKVYKGNLQDGDGFKTIVAKRLDTRFGQGEQQFFSELQILLLIHFV
uniref:Protein kinase domain-containing protein n=1 Tax=Helianthus annuus TaxID=4232 RepID=A0A1Y3BUZ4_HELAN